MTIMYQFLSYRYCLLRLTVIKRIAELVTTEQPPACFERCREKIIKLQEIGNYKYLFEIFIV